MSFWQVIGRNLLGFDLIIFIAAAADAVCFLLGFLVTMIRWAVKHPEDFFTRDDAPDEAKETEER